MPHMLITGAYGGLGRYVAEAATQAGWTLITPRSTEVDLRSHDAMQAFAGSLPDDLRAVVHLVGGITAGKTVEETAPEDVAAMFELNVTTTFNVLLATLPMLKHHGGSVVTIGARDVLHPLGNRAAYASSKAAVASLTQVIAEEGRAHGVRANCILPGIIRTEANLSWADDATVALMVAPEQIAATIVDLCRDSNAVSGAIIPMYGGFPY